MTAYDPEKPIELYTDTNKVRGLGYVMAQNWMMERKSYPDGKHWSYLQTIPCTSSHLSLGLWYSAQSQL